ncbi:tape measure protein [Chryseobacterium manosquense]|uniref:Tape measure protein n=1 Tax=Chryseobacterium manosquense TaxID=2754694 RepID=A0A7H1DT77_9FLAO|nr:tape measure protein [Chryseobacterium manosquense]QNS40185.1 tape measure protein [Chryseobacterium manosquense]
MNTNQGALYFGAGIDLQQWRNNVNEMRRDILGLTNTTQQQTKQMDTSFRNIGLGLTTYFSGAALGGFVNQIINVRGEFQKTEIAFGTMLKSTDKAKELMGQMVELAAKTPFSLQDVSAGAKQLLAFQVPANEVVDTLTRMGNIAAGLGVPLSRINLVYGQVMAKGKLMGDDLRQFTEAGIPMVAELAKKFGTSTAEISKMVTAGKIGFKDVQDVLFGLTNEGGMFFNLMEKQSKSLSGQIANLGDSFDQMLNKLGESNQNILTDGIAATAYLVDNYETVAEIIGVMVASYGAYRAALIATAALNQMQNTTIASEIKLLGISEKMKLGRAMVTQRQAEATARETAVELSGVQAKYAALQAEVSILAIKKQSAIQSGINATAKAQEAQVQLALARAELSSIQATGSARQIQIAQKNVEKAQNTAIATQESASIARKRALGAATEFNTAKQSLENTAQKVGVATKTAATAAEAAQVAAKNANAISTTRLTVMQNIQTFATRTAASAQAFLNATLLGNPIALVIGLIAGLTYVIYKNITATSAYAEIQDKLNAKVQQYSTSLDEQKSKIDTLLKVIKDKNTTDKVAQGALNEINKLTNNRISGLTVEGIRLGQNAKALNAYLQVMEKEVRLRALIDEKIELEKRNKDIDRDNPNNLTFGERFSNLKGIGDVFKGLTAQERKERAMLENRIATNKRIRENEAETQRLIQEGIKVADDSVVNTLNSGTEDVKKAKEKRDRELAEVYSLNSIADLEQRIALWNEALQKASGDTVNELTKNKFGDTVKTGNTVSVNQALDELEKLEKAKATRQKEITRLSFDEELAETERQWKVKYMIAQQYGQKIADEQFPELKGSYYSDIDKRRLELESKLSSGVGLSDEELRQYEKLQQIINSLTGQKDPLSNFNDGIDVALRKLPSLTAQIEYLTNLRDSQTDEGTSQGFYAAADARLNAKLTEQRNIFKQLLEEQRTYEEKSLALQEEYDDMRALAKTDAEKEKVDKSYSKKFTDLFFEQMQGSEEWSKVFIDMNEVATEQLEKFKIILQQKLSEAKTIEEKIKIGEFIKKIEQAISGRNFIPNFSKAIKALGDDSLSTAEKIKIAKEEIEKFQNQLGFAKEIISGVSDIFTSLGGNMDSAFGDILSNLDQTISGLQQFGEGASKAIEGFASGNILQGVAGTIKAIGGAIKSVSGWLNGDKKKERSIKKQAAQLKELEMAYNNLAFAAERAFGSQKYSGQQDLIKNLEQQKAAIQGMMNAENSKKKSDKNKINEYQSQIQSINQSIAELQEGIIKDVLQTDIPDMASQMGDALVEAFARGEDGVEAINKAFDDLVKNMLKNQLNKILEVQMSGVIANMQTAMGFNADGSGAFDGLTEQEIADLRAQVQAASAQGQQFIEAYSQIFGDLASPAEGLKGDIKGITEKTAGALESQINAIRIYQVEANNIHKSNQQTFIASLQQLVQIEFNTRNLIQIRQDISEMNSKMARNLAGFG